MEGCPTIAGGPMPVMEETERVGHQFKGRRADALSFPIDIGTAASPVFGNEGGKPFLQETAIESSVMGNHEHGPSQQIVDGSIVDAVTGHHLISYPGQVGDLGWDRKAGIFESLP